MLVVSLPVAFDFGYSWWLALLHIVAVLSVLSAAWAYYGTVRERKLALLPHIVLQYVVCGALLVLVVVGFVIGALRAGDLADTLPESAERVAAFFLFLLVASLLLLASLSAAHAAYAVRNFYDCLEQQPAGSDDDADNVV
ncbi:hypothetical protein AAVH_40090 [Aphelenchoides avenae]|nr:hypothetical protein AAVH_40090 [Aphelenchus avenae]